jgi:hypothetical protein
MSLELWFWPNFSEDCENSRTESGKTFLFRPGLVRFEPWVAKYVHMISLKLCLLIFLSPLFIHLEYTYSFLFMQCAKKGGQQTNFSF